MSNKMFDYKGYKIPIDHEGEVAILVTNNVSHEDTEVDCEFYYVNNIAGVRNAIHEYNRREWSIIKRNICTKIYPIPYGFGLHLPNESPVISRSYIIRDMTFDDIYESMENHIATLSR